MVPVVWAMTDVDATTAITPATAAARKLAIMARLRTTSRSRDSPLIISELKNVEALK
jgi:hypothetical protein